MKSFLGIFYRHLAIFSGHTGSGYQSVLYTLSQLLEDGAEVTFQFRNNIGQRFNRPHRWACWNRMIANKQHASALVLAWKHCWSGHVLPKGWLGSTNILRSQPFKDYVCKLGLYKQCTSQRNSSRVVIYDCNGFMRLPTCLMRSPQSMTAKLNIVLIHQYLLSITIKLSASRIIMKTLILLIFRCVWVCNKINKLLRQDTS